MILRKKPLAERVYTTILDLPLSAFIDVLCDKKLASLKRKGEKASMQECVQAWKLVFDGYVDAVMDKDSEFLNKAEYRMHQLAMKINMVNTCAAYLRGYIKVTLAGAIMDEPIDEVVRLIKKEAGSMGSFNLNDPEQFEKDIQLAENSIKRYQIEINNKRMELQAILPKSSKEVVSRDAFLLTLTRMNRWAKVRFRPEEITVFEFVKNINDWKMESDLINKERKRK